MKIVKRPDTSSELLLQPCKNGVKIIRPQEARCINPTQLPTLDQILNLPCSVFFDNSEHAAEKVNEISAQICGYVSAEDAIGHTVFDFTTKETALRFVSNQQQVMTSQRMHIVEDILIKKDEIPFSFVAISFPWYSNEDKVIGVFGCSIVLNHHSIAQSFSELCDFGLLTKQKYPSTFTPIPCHTSFTRREKQCISLIMQGKSPKEIGILLFLSHRTIEHYIENIKDKIGVTTKAEMIVKLTEIINSQENFI